MPKRTLTLLLLCLTAPALAQLVSVDRNYRVTKVDYAMNRLEVQYLDRKTPTLFVDLDGHTQVLLARRTVDWHSLMRDWIIEVKGGLSPGLHIKARTIIVHAT